MKRNKDGVETFGIYEVYYYEDKNQAPGWTESPIGHEYDSVEELKEDLRRQMGATKKPILDYDKDFSSL
jgi:hypothetical protein